MSMTPEQMAKAERAIHRKQIQDIQVHEHQEAYIHDNQIRPV